MPVPEQAIVIGIGGTGAKCVEALCHLAVSGHSPQNIYPILIDQDSKNGNVKRCKNALQAYADLRKKSNVPRKWFFTPTFNLFDKLLPLLPQEENKNYGAAIGLPSMDTEEATVTKALYLPNQLNESLDSGYKKRAHMGSLLIQQMLEKEEEKLANEEGLNFVIDKLKRVQQPHVVIYGSLFGGTGASGLVRIGKYFKEKMDNAIVKGVFLTPYFIIGKSSESDKDANLIKSDADMQAVKIVLQLYRDEIKKSFHNVFIVGSEISRLDGEYVTDEAKYGGPDQENPAHVFELLAATVPFLEYHDTRSQILSFVAETEKQIPPAIFSLSSNYPKNSPDEYNATLSIDILKIKRFVLVRDFANMLFQVSDHNEKTWWKRQPWVDIVLKADLLNWAFRHIAWWKEMSPDLWNKHRWGKFPLRLNTQIPEYLYSSYLSRYILKKISI